MPSVQPHTRRSVHSEQLRGRQSRLEKRRASFRAHAEACGLQLLVPIPTVRNLLCCGRKNRTTALHVKVEMHVAKQRKAAENSHGLTRSCPFVASYASYVHGWLHMLSVFFKKCVRI